MKYLVNSREMKLYDKNTTEHYKIPSIVLMERAAVSFVEELRRQRVDTSSVLLVCGSGNNGGDGLAIARLLLLAGSKVTVVLLEDGKKASPENQLQQQILDAYQCERRTEIPAGERYTAIIDALFGVGLCRNLNGDYKSLIEQMNALPGVKIAVDIPSGISADSGALCGTAFRADITITFAYEKIGLRLFPGAEFAGQIFVEEIGIERHSWLDKEPFVCAMEDEDLAFLGERIAYSNKGTYGKLLVIAGGINMAGAASLSAKAAYAAGCGLVRVVTPEENRVILQSTVPEAILSTYSAKNPEEACLIEAINWSDAIVCGPGIGTSRAAEQIVSCVLKNSSVPVVLDADALNVIAKDVSRLLRPHTELIVTPHLGEMSRLTGDSVSYLASRLLDAAGEFARQYHVICVLKDARAVTSIPYGRTYLNVSGNPGMATAGSGDVLSGIIGSLLVQGMQPKEAAPLGVFLHGRAGDVMAEQVGKRGLVATDLIEGIRKLGKKEEMRKKS
ncbi:MAG: NAD(P)H-hydrate dehydratase [Clostridiales bacterium]|nr:NAD(P)H-hydrate dehydratase [Clostridiales bacterium]